MPTIAEIEKKRADLRAKAEEKREEQRAIDLGALLELEETLGVDQVASVEIPNCVPDLPTMVIVKMPSPQQYKQFRDLRMADKIAHSLTAIADHCVVYPARDVYQKLREAVPAIHDGAANAAIRLSQGGIKEEGKG